MDEIADLCDQRHNEMCAESGGSDLMALSSWPQVAEDESQQHMLHHNSLPETPFPALPTRQDHNQVAKLLQLVATDAILVLQ